MKKPEVINEVNEIEQYVMQLSAPERKTLLKGLRRKILFKEARELKKSVNKNVQITIEEVLKEINAVRRKNAA